MIIDIGIPVVSDLFFKASNTSSGIVKVLNLLFLFLVIVL